MAKPSLATAIAVWLSLTGASVAVASQFYRWVDQHGVVHFTDNLHNIPGDRRGDAVRIQAKESPKAKDLTRASPPTKASIPFEKHGQVVVIDARLNNKASAKLVVDTGASYTMISNAIAKELNVQPSGSQSALSFQTAAGIIQAPVVTLQSIIVGGMEVKDLAAAIHDIAPGSAVAGLLGLNFLSNFRLDIDTENGVLHLERR